MIPFGGQVFYPIPRHVYLTTLMLNKLSHIKCYKVLLFLSDFYFRPINVTQNGAMHECAIVLCRLVEMQLICKCRDGRTVLINCHSKLRNSGKCLQKLSFSDQKKINFVLLSRKSCPNSHFDLVIYNKNKKSNRNKNFNIDVEINLTILFIKKL